MHPSLFIGLMSGTSLDGADGVLVDFSNPKSVQVLAHAHHPMPNSLKQEFFALNQRSDDELHRSSIAANQLVMQVYTPIVNELLSLTNTQANQVCAIGAHGQTIRHHPNAELYKSYTTQINSPALLAEEVNISVICDFRSRDIAAGGQGAPLACAFHAAMFSKADKNIAILNLGGIANLTLLMPSGSVIGFDCGPANALMDEWAQQHINQAFDHDGLWAASGTVEPRLLQSMLSEPFFAQTAPKSTGRDLFHLGWLQHHLNKTQLNAAPENIQASLLELTAQTCVKDLLRYMPQTDQLLVCGGGALNTHLMKRLQELLPQTQVATTALYGISPLQVEAIAFAWLAHQCIHQQPANLPEVTGAKGKRILGAIYSR